VLSVLVKRKDTVIIADTVIAVVPESLYHQHKRKLGKLLK